MKLITKYIDSLKNTIEYSVGESAEENFEIIDNSTPEDMWFHAQGCSSCHVIAKIAGMELTKKQLRQIVTQGAVLCKQYSRYANMSNLVIIYTRLKNIKKTEVVGRVLSKEVKSKII